MQNNLIQQLLKREINTLRRESGHNRPVPEDIWQVTSIKSALATAVRCVTTDPPDFEFDYELAREMTALNKAITAEYERRVLDPHSIAEQFRRRHRSRREKDHLEISQGTPNEWQCGQAVGEYFAREMERDDKVSYFRHYFSGGRLLTLHEAWEALTSPIFQILSLSDFQNLDLPWADRQIKFTPYQGARDDLPIPLREHEAKLSRAMPIEEWQGGESTWYVVEADTPTGSIQRTVAVSKHSLAFKGEYPMVSQREFTGETGPEIEPALEQYEGG